MKRTPSPFALLTFPRGLLLGGVLAAPTASLTMVVAPSPAHATPATPAKTDKTGIEWAVEPGDVVIYLDDKKLGDAASVKFTETKPGKHTVRLVLSKDETETDVVVQKGKILKFTFSFGG
jgi:hypothetical protein